MELLAALLLALPTIFIAAFLAATLETYRERLRTRKWVMRNLWELAGGGRFDMTATVEDAVRQWLAASAPDDLTEQTWRQVWFVSISNAPDLGPLLRGEAATAVPPEVFIALRDFEDAISNIRQIDMYVNETFIRDVAPLWYERRAPLTGPDQLRVEWFLRLLKTRQEGAERGAAAMERFREALAEADRGGAAPAR